MLDLAWAIGKAWLWALKMVRDLGNVPGEEAQVGADVGYFMGDGEGHGVGARDGK